MPEELIHEDARVFRGEPYTDTEPGEAPGFLGPMLRLLNPYKRIIGALMGLAGVGVVAVGFGLWAVSPVQKEANLDFRLDFDGIQDGKYPNGTKFSVEDLLSEPVVRRVYDENGLQKFAPFEKFRASLAVTSSNRELELLEMGYKARLADTKLAPIDRQKIEKEFQEKAAALKTSTFRLTLFRSERLREMDAALIEKILRGILNAWADDAAKIRGALKYDLPVYSKAMIQKEFLQSEDYLIGVDMLRTKINRVLASLDQLLKIPGIQLVRLPGSGLSLPEIQIRLEHLNTFRIGPAIGILRSTGLSKSPAATLLYIQNRLFETNLDQKLAQERERKLRDAFEVYVGFDKRGAVAGKALSAGEGAAGAGRELGTAAVIPQFGESFIDRLMQLANRNSDVAFRQELTERIIKAGLAQADYAKETAFYKELEASFRGGLRPNSDPAVRATALREAESRFASGAEELEKGLDDIQAVYDLVSVRNLRPASFLYTVERPMAIYSTTAFSVSRYAVFAVLFIALVGFAAAAACFIHARLRTARA
jgi:hypothetical protein